MRACALFLALFAVLSPSLCLKAAESSAVPVARPTADEAWAEVRALGLLETFPAGYVEEVSTRKKHAMMEQHMQRLREKGLAFYTAFPSDPRRWSLVMRMSMFVPRFLVSAAADREESYDTAAATAWRAKLAELNAAMLVANDLPADVREAQDSRATGALLLPLLNLTKTGPSPDWAKIKEHLQSLSLKYPENSYADGVMRGAMAAFEKTHPPMESAAVWREFLDFPNPRLANTAQEKVGALELMSGPIEFAFTALDGRQIDLKQLRGKVVLIDFWATWCGPCMLEMPNVKKVYAAYHDQGFEIIGVSCDYSPAPGPKGRYAGTGPEVLAFTRKEGMPWPQHYEGKKHNEGGNTLATRFAVTAIPAAFLLDQTGTVVATNLRGAALEQAVKRLLKL